MATRTETTTSTKKQWRTPASPYSSCVDHFHIAICLSSGDMLANECLRQRGTRVHKKSCTVSKDKLDAVGPRRRKDAATQRLVQGQEARLDIALVDMMEWAYGFSEGS